MNKTVIALYSSYMGAYDVPLFLDIREDDDLKENYRRMILMDPDKAYQYRIHEKVLCKLGEFDDVKGEFILLDAPLKLVDLATLFPVGYLARKESVNG